MFNEKLYNQSQIRFIRIAMQNDSIDISDLDPTKYSADQMRKVWHGRRGDKAGNIDDLNPCMYSVKQMEFISKVRFDSTGKRFANIDDLDPKRFTLDFMKIISKYRLKKEIKVSAFESIDLTRFDKKKFEELVGNNQDLNNITHWPELVEDVSVNVIPLKFDESFYKKRQLAILLKGREGKKGFGNIDDLDPRDYNDQKMKFISLGRGDHHSGNIDDLEAEKYTYKQMEFISKLRFENKYFYIEHLNPKEYDIESMKYYYYLQLDKERYNYPNIDLEDLTKSNYDEDQLFVITLGRSENPIYGNIDDLNPKIKNAGQMAIDSRKRGVSWINSALNSNDLESFEWFIKNYSGEQSVQSFAQFTLSNVMRKIDKDADTRFLDCVLSVGVDATYPMQWAVENSNLKVLKLLCEKFDAINLILKDGKTPLISLLNNQILSYNCIKYLLDSGANPDIKESRTYESFRDKINNLMLDNDGHHEEVLIKINKLLKSIDLDSRSNDDEIDPRIANAKFDEYWEKYVPDSGVSETHQGEVLRLIGRIFSEYRRNGNINWNKEFELSANWLRNKLNDKDVFSLKEIHLNDEAINVIVKIGKSGKLNYDVNFSYFELVQGMCVKWCMKNTKPIKLVEEMPFS